MNYVMVLWLPPSPTTIAGTGCAFPEHQLLIMLTVLLTIHSALSHRTSADLQTLTLTAHTVGIGHLYGSWKLHLSKIMHCATQTDEKSQFYCVILRLTYAYYTSPSHYIYSNFLLFPHLITIYIQKSYKNKKKYARFPMFGGLGIKH